MTDDAVGGSISPLSGLPAIRWSQQHQRRHFLETDYTHMEKWYALHTKPNSEYQVAGALNERGIEVFLPSVRRKWGQDWREKPFFPCYLFAHFDAQKVGYSAINWTPGLRRLVSFGGRPAVVPDEAIDLIREHLDELADLGGLPSHDFKVGQEVRIKSGPLEGLHAIFQGPMGPVERVRVLVEFLGETSRAELPVEELERVKPVGGRERRPRRTRGRGRFIRRRKPTHPTEEAARTDGRKAQPGG